MRGTKLKIHEVMHIRKGMIVMNISGIRKQVYTAEPYVPGKSMEDVKQQYNLTEVIKLGSNENPYGPFPNSIEAMKKEIGIMNIYPETNFIKLKELLGEKEGFTSDYIGIGHGAGNVLETLGRQFIEEGDEVIVPTQSYRLYREISKVMGGIVKEISLDENYTINIDDIIKAVTPRTKLIWICNPNNPTGTVIDKDKFDRLLSIIPVSTWIVADEAYAEFTDADNLPPTLEYIKNEKHIVVVRTFSKYYGLAGARIGYVVADPKVIDAYERVSEPFNSNRIALAGAIASLTTDKANCENALKLLQQERKKISEKLEKENYEVIASHSNFVFFKVPCDAEELGELLLEEGVVVRPCSGWGYPQHIRVSIGTEEEMNVFFEALKRNVNKLSS